MNPLLIAWLLVAAAAAALSVSRVGRWRTAWAARDAPSDAAVVWSARCGFTVRAPGRVAFSYPAGRLDVAADAVVVRGPSCEYRFDARGSVAESSEAISILHVVELRDEQRRIEVHLRRRDELMSVLSERGWVVD